MNKKYDLSVLIPSRNEMFLSRTVDDILRKKQGNTEVIVALDGTWAEPGISDHENVTIIYFPESIGQRAATNQAARLSKAKYVMKLDAHCALDEGFDVKLMADMQDNWTVIPTMYNLHAFDWVCTNCGDRQYQGPSDKYGICDKCGGKREKEILFQPRMNRRSYYYRFDKTLHFQYWGDYGNRSEAQGDIVPIMSAQGSCFFLTREKYWELEICDEKSAGKSGWGQQGVEVALKTWLSGGQLMVNKKTWYSHMFRTQGGDFGFPYPLSGNEVSFARSFSKDLWFNNKFKKQIYPLSWLLEKFNPIPDWHDDLNNDVLRTVTDAGAIFSSTHPLTDSTNSFGMVSSIEQPEISPRMSSSTSIKSSSESIVSMGNESEMGGITTSPVITNDMIKFGSTNSNREGSNNPSVHQSMDTNSSSILPTHSRSTIIEESSISSMVNFTSPVPATSQGINLNIGKESSDSSGIKVRDSEEFKHGNIVQQNMDNVNREIIFYTDNQLKLKYAHAVQNSLRKVGLPIISSSLKPMPHFGNNIHIPRERGMETYFIQIIAALEKSTADVVYMCEHDVIYHPSHFQFVPPTKDKFYYNLNFWRIRPEQDNLAVHWDANQVSGLVAYRELLLDWYKKKWEKVQREGFDRSYEPGGRNSDQVVTWKSEYPNIDIRHGKNLTKSKWSLNDFRDKSTSKGWEESTIDKIPGWDTDFLQSLLSFK